MYNTSSQNPVQELLLQGTVVGYNKHYNTRSLRHVCVLCVLSLYNIILLVYKTPVSRVVCRVSLAIFRGRETRYRKTTVPIAKYNRVVHLRCVIIPETADTLASRERRPRHCCKTAENRRVFLFIFFFCFAR